MKLSRMPSGVSYMLARLTGAALTACTFAAIWWFTRSVFIPLLSDPVVAAYVWLGGLTACTFGAFRSVAFDLIDDFECK